MYDVGVPLLTLRLATTTRKPAFSIMDLQEQKRWIEPPLGDEILPRGRIVA
jgi:hypothetical protein